MERGGGGRERGGTCKYRGKLHGHTRTFTDNSTCMLLVRSWTRMKELVPVQQTSKTATEKTLSMYQSQNHC